MTRNCITITYEGCKRFECQFRNADFSSQLNYHYIAKSTVDIHITLQDINYINDTDSYIRENMQKVC